nr:hypothetical protein CFP56_11071 [Quercus suber]
MFSCKFAQHILSRSSLASICQLHDNGQLSLSGRTCIVGAVKFFKLPATTLSKGGKQGKHSYNASAFRPSDVIDYCFSEGSVILH